MGPIRQVKPGIQGIILAGGKSSRFGEDKALAQVDGVRMIERSICLLERVGFDPVVITNAIRDYAFLQRRIERDRVSGKGPLGGLYTACCCFPAQSLLVLTCDMPALTASLLEEMISRHDRQYDATVFLNPKGWAQPFPGLYESRISERIQKLLERSDLSLRGFLGCIQTQNIAVNQDTSDLFFNINTRKDLESWPLLHGVS